MRPFDSDVAGSQGAAQAQRGDRVPPGQKVVANWPILSYGVTPRIDLRQWRLHTTGLVEEEATFTWDDFMAMPQSEVTCDIHCVTAWSRLDNRFGGVLFRDFVRYIRPRAEARYVMVYCYGGYTTNVPLADLMTEQAMLAHSHDGQPLLPEHGGPMRLVVPHLYFWKSAKWVSGLEFMAKDRPGFWENYGYHIRGDPWREERYS